MSERSGQKEFRQSGENEFFHWFPKLSLGCIVSLKGFLGVALRTPRLQAHHIIPFSATLRTQSYLHRNLIYDPYAFNSQSNSIGGEVLEIHHSSNCLLLSVGLHTLIHQIVDLGKVGCVQATKEVVQDAYNFTEDLKPKVIKQKNLGREFWERRQEFLTKKGLLLV